MPGFGPGDATIYLSLLEEARAHNPVTLQLLTPKEKGYFSGTKIRAKIHSKYELWLESSSCCPWRSLFGL